MRDLRMPELHCYDQNHSLKIIARYKRQSIDQCILFVIFNANKLLTNRTLLISQENDDLIDFS
jgi:hypothetical protein